MNQSETTPTTRPETQPAFPTSILSKEDLLTHILFYTNLGHEVSIKSFGEFFLLNILKKEQAPTELQPVVSVNVSGEATAAADNRTEDSTPVSVRVADPTPFDSSEIESSFEESESLEEQIAIESSIQSRLPEGWTYLGNASTSTSSTPEETTERPLTFEDLFDIPSEIHQRYYDEYEDEEYEEEEEYEEDYEEEYEEEHEKPLVHHPKPVSLPPSFSPLSIVERVQLVESNQNIWVAEKTATENVLDGETRLESSDSLIFDYDKPLIEPLVLIVWRDKLDNHPYFTWMRLRRCEGIPTLHRLVQDIQEKRKEQTANENDE